MSLFTSVIKWLLDRDDGWNKPAGQWQHVLMVNWDLLVVPVSRPVVGWVHLQLPVSVCDSKMIRTEPSSPAHYAMLPRCPLTSLQDGVLLGAVGAYDWNGAVLKETKHGKVVPPKSSYKDEFPEELKNHGAYLGNRNLYSDSLYVFDIDNWFRIHTIITIQGLSVMKICFVCRTLVSF